MPGSGKSYFAAELQKAIGLEQVVMLDPDAIDFQSQDYLTFTKTAFAQEVDPKIQPFRYLKTQAFEGIVAGKIIIWNQPFTNRGMFDRLVASLKEYAESRGTKIETLLVEVDIDNATATERVRSRIREGGHGPSENTLNQRINEYESFAESGYEMVHVDGSGNVDANVTVVMETIRRIQSAR